MKSSRVLTCACVLLGSLWLAGHVAELQVWGVTAAEGGPSRTALASGPLTLKQAIHLAQERYRARVVRSETREEEGRTLYVLRMLSTSGRVWTVRVDAHSGALL